MIIDIKFMKQKKISPIWVVSCVIFLFTTLSYAQTITDTIPASQYFKKGDAFLTDRKLDSAVVYFEKALPIYRNAKTWERVARCYNKISESQIFDEKYVESLDNAKKALEISSRYLKKSNGEEAYSYDNIGNYYNWNRLDFEMALDYCHKALKIRLEIFPKDHLDIAYSYSNIGTILVRQHKGNKALPYYQKSLQIRKEKLGTSHINTSRTYFNIGLIYYRQEEFDKALNYLKTVLSIRTKVLPENHIELANCNDLIGRIYKMKGKYDKALVHLQSRLSILIYNKGEKHKSLITANNYIGICYKNMGQYDKALYYYKQALNVKRKIEEQDENIIVPYVFNNIGIIYKYKGEYDKALIYCKKGIDDNIKINGENHKDVSTSYNNVGNLYRLKGDYNRSLIYYTKALAIRRKIFDQGNSKIADSYNDIGELYSDKNDYSKAIDYCIKSLTIRIEVFGKYHPDVADSYASLGAIYKNELEYSTALGNYNTALEIRQRLFGEHHPKVAQSYNDVAKVYFAQNDFEKALINYENAITANTMSNTNAGQYLNLDVLLSTLKGKAKTYKKLFQKSKDIGMLNNAIKTYQKADTLINKIRQTFTNYQDKVAFAKKAKELYQGAIEAQLLLYDHNQDQKSLEQAFYYAEKSKSNTLKELLAASNAKNFTGISTDLLELEKELRINNSFYKSKITEERSSQATDSTKITNYESRLFDINRRQDSLTAVLEKNYPKYYQVKHENNITSVVDIQKNLKENTTLLEFFVADSSSYAFIISKNNLAVQELKTQNLTHRIEQLREAITSKNIEDYKQFAYGLYDELLAPITDKLVGDELIVIPDGPLWHLNFELLLTQKDVSNNPKTLSYLLKDYAVTYANSANLLFRTQKNQGAKKRQECLAFSFTDSTNIVDTKTMSLATLRDTGDDLPGTRKEIRAISDIIDGRYYFGSQAVESNFKKNAGEYNILHLALHGDVDNQRPENSKLYFTKSKDTIEDNLLYAHELFALDIPAELTVLSACNTGTGKIAKGEGIMSLGSAFQYAGTKSLLLSSWEVSDQTTPELMRYFYTNLKLGMNKSKALQQAKLQYLKTANVNRVHPFYWGGFYLVGDSAPIAFSDNSQLYWVLGILMLTVLLGSLFLYRRKNHL